MTVGELKSTIDAWTRIPLIIMLAIICLFAIPEFSRPGGAVAVIAGIILFIDMTSIALLIFLSSFLSPAQIADLKVAELPTMKGIGGYGAWAAGCINRWREEGKYRLVRHLAAWGGLALFGWCSIAVVDQMQNITFDGRVIPRELTSLNLVPAPMGFLTGVLLIAGAGALGAFITTLRSPMWVVSRVASDVGVWTAGGFIIGFAQFLYAIYVRPGVGQVRAVDDLLNYSLAGALVGILLGLVRAVAEAIETSPEAIPRNAFHNHSVRPAHVAICVSVVTMATAAAAGILMPRALLATGISTAIYDDYAGDASAKAFEFEKIRREAAAAKELHPRPVVDSEIKREIEQDLTKGRGRVQGNDGVNGWAFWLALVLLFVACVRGGKTAAGGGRLVASHDVRQGPGKPSESSGIPAYASHGGN